MEGIRGKNNSSNAKGFSLVEMLIAIAVVSILSAAVIFLLNPVEYLKKGRDAQRISDLSNLHTLIGKYQFSYTRDRSLGETNTVYVSLPDTDPECANLSLPTLAGGWSYACVTQENLYNVDGTGWLPINIASVSLAGIAALPVDPQNIVSGGLYYRYATNGSTYELNAAIESEQFGQNGTQDIVSTDGGDASSLYEIGTSLSIAPAEE
jgi:prepilin-type N-terminal cleavage/methylation domain-containing protein